MENSGYGSVIKGCYAGMFGYSGDDILLSLSISILQKMITICEEYAVHLGLSFSTDPNPLKSKTKCMAFLTKPRELPRLMLCGNPLPWVDSLLHLGNLVSNKLDGGQADMERKVARYIENGILDSISC